MNLRWRDAILGLFFGALLGGSGVQLYHYKTSEKSKDVFNKRLRCNAIAKKYAQTQSTGSLGFFIALSLNIVDYSEARNSCIAEYTQDSSNINDKKQNFSLITIIDLGTQEKLAIEPCTNESDCVSALQRAEPKFSQIVRFGTVKK